MAVVGEDVVGVVVETLGRVFVPVLLLEEPCMGGGEDEEVVGGE